MLRDDEYVSLHVLNVTFLRHLKERPMTTQNKLRFKKGKLYRSSPKSEIYRCVNGRTKTEEGDRLVHMAIVKPEGTVGLFKMVDGESDWYLADEFKEELSVATAREAFKADLREVEAAKDAETTTRGKRGSRRSGKPPKDATKVNPKGEDKGKRKRGSIEDRIKAAKNEDKATREKVGHGLSLGDAAHRVLVSKKSPMTCGEIVEEIIKRKLWSTAGKTPANTLYTIILRDLKNPEPRFKKSGRGLFEAA